MIVLIGVIYVAMLFAIAGYAEKRKSKGKSLINNPWVYSLSLAVYCTSWTYYGSVGKASKDGIEFLTVYLGPSAAAALFMVVLHKMLRISKQMRITSLADFISTRYGKNFSLGVIVSLCTMAGLIPYIGLQIKSITATLQILAADGGISFSKVDAWLGLAITAVLFGFTVLYGARSIDTAEKHEGLVAVVAFESIIKLIAFLAVGAFVCFSLFNGPAHLFSSITNEEKWKQLSTLRGEAPYFQFTALTILSGLAFLLLPRQFQVAVVENKSEKHLRTATWMLPLYLLLINLFVLPISWAGELILQGSADPDSFLLTLPLHDGQSALAMLVWIGGFSAATGMIVIETIALSIMISNNILMPALLRKVKQADEQDVSLQKPILRIRRIIIAVVLFASLLYMLSIGTERSLVSIGMISFCAVVQLAPALFGGMYWKLGNRKGAIAGIVSGFAIWFYMLVLPDIIASADFAENGPMGIRWLSPLALLDFEGLDPVSITFFITMIVNISLYVLVSLHTRSSVQESYQATLFTNVFQIKRDDSTNIFNGTYSGTNASIQRTLVNFLGMEKTRTAVAEFARKSGQPWQANAPADPSFLAYAERILGGIIGTASAHILLAGIAQENEVELAEVIQILKENQQTIEVNKQLRRQQVQLSKATRQLEKANALLKQLDEQKDEFLYTVTHELRTPLTSIRALGEILIDHPDLDEQQRIKYLEGITKETERLSHLINQVLTLEKYESGRYKLHLSAVNLYDIASSVVTRLQTLAQEAQLEPIQLKGSDTQAIAQVDADLITQVIYNLVSNAIKFAKKSIKVSITEINDDWQISIKDDGQGIDPALHHLVFDKFFQAKNQPLQKPLGTGLGLAICKRIVDMHNGTIHIESKVGEGTSFTVSLPIQ